MPDLQPPRPTYDPNEIRRCIALCFSPKDLRTFAENLGVTNLGTWDRGIQDGAREVVRHYERLGTLDELVAKLAEARPLMEWPAQQAPTASPFAPPPPPAPTPPPAPAPVAGPLPPPVAPSPTDVLSDAAETNPPAAPEPVPFAPRVISASTAALPVKPAALPTQPEPEPMLRDPFAPAFPGTAAGSSATNAKQLDGRKLAPFLAAGVVLISLITIGIFLAVRVGKNPETAAPEIVAGRPMRPDGPARLAADAMKKSFESLARGCDLELQRGAEVDSSLFSAAYAQCGMRIGAAFPPPGLRPDKLRNPGSNDAANDSADEPPNAGTDSPAVNTPHQTNPGRNPAPRPAPAPAPTKAAPSSGCIDKCSATQRQCNRACGNEPTSSNGYDRWQGCQTQCLSAASRCRLACQ